MCQAPGDSKQLGIGLACNTLLTTSPKSPMLFAMLLFITFILGVANFAMQKAMMESDHPLVSEARRAMRRYLGAYGSYILEFVFLIAAFFFASIGMLSGVIGYIIYTLANGAGAWVLRSRK